MTTAKAPAVTRQTFVDRYRMATTAPYDDGTRETPRVGNSKDIERLTRSLSNLTVWIIEDGPQGDAEIDAVWNFINEMGFEIERRIVDFAFSFESETRPRLFAEDELSREAVAFGTEHPNASRAEPVSAGV